MSADAEPATEATPPVRARRFTPKLLVVAGGAALSLLLLLGGATWLLWPAAEKSSVAKARHPKPASMQAAAASAPVLSADVAAAPASAAAAEAAATAPALVRQDEAAQPPLAVRPTPPPPAAVAEAPLDRLQRRLGQVLGAKAAVDAGHGGEWRLVTRTSSDVTPQVASARAAGVSLKQAAGHAAPTENAGRAAHGSHWSYEGRGGPQAWGQLKPEFSTCANGQRQSPIDIRDGLALELEPVQFAYQSSRFGVIDTGHTVQVNPAPGNSIDINGRRYELLQFHFHRPSEERINGRQFDMVVHLVHKDAEGRLAVVAVLLERGAAQPLLQTVWNNLPLERGEEVAARATLDLNELLPAQRGYYTYMGSLTTPPCSEGVLWVVLQQPVQVSGTQIDIFSRLYPMNARPIQQASGRLIKQSQ